MNLLEGFVLMLIIVFGWYLLTSSNEFTIDAPLDVSEPTTPITSSDETKYTDSLEQNRDDNARKPSTTVFQQQTHNEHQSNTTPSPSHQTKPSISRSHTTQHNSDYVQYTPSSTINNIKQVSATTSQNTTQTYITPNQEYQDELTSLLQLSKQVEKMITNSATNDNLPLPLPPTFYSVFLISTSFACCKFGQTMRFPHVRINEINAVCVKKGFKMTSINTFPCKNGLYVERRTRQMIKELWPNATYLNGTTETLIFNEEYDDAWYLTNIYLPLQIKYKIKYTFNVISRNNKEYECHSIDDYDSVSDTVSLHSNYVLDTDDIIKLKEMGFSERLIKYALQKSEGNNGENYVASIKDILHIMLTSIYSEDDMDLNEVNPVRHQLSPQLANYKRIKIGLSKVANIGLNHEHINGNSDDKDLNEVNGCRYSNYNEYNDRKRTFDEIATANHVNNEPKRKKRKMDNRSDDKENYNYNANTRKRTYEKYNKQNNRWEISVPRIEKESSDE